MLTDSGRYKCDYCGKFVAYDEIGKTAEMKCGIREGGLYMPVEHYDVWHVSCRNKAMKLKLGLEQEG